MGKCMNCRYYRRELKNPGFFCTCPYSDRLGEFITPDYGCRFYQQIGLGWESMKEVESKGEVIS